MSFGFLDVNGATGGTFRPRGRRSSRRSQHHARPRRERAIGLTRQRRCANRFHAACLLPWSWSCELWAADQRWIRERVPHVGEQIGALCGGQCEHGVARRLGLAAMPQDRLHQRASAAIVEVARNAGRTVRIRRAGGVTEGVIGEAQAPQRRGPPLALTAWIGEALAEIMEQEITERLDHLSRELARFRIGCGDEARYVTCVAARCLEQRLAAERRGIAMLRARRHG